MDRYLFENFVFEFEDEEMIEKSLIFFAQQAKNKVEKKGNKKITFNYYPQKENNLQLVIESIRDGKNICVNNMKVHHTSPDIWKLKIINSFSNFEDCYMASRENSEGFVIIRLVNEQVLGEIKAGDIIEVQVVAFAMAIDIFKNEKEYKKKVPKSKNGQKYFMEDGALIPFLAIVNNSANLTPEEREKKDHSFDNLVDVKGTIKQCWSCPLNIFGMDVDNYYMAEIDTEFGPLHIVIPQPMIPEGLEGFGVGNIITGKILLSGDVCINKYEKYISELVIKNEEKIKNDYN